MACRENNWSLEAATFYTEVVWEYQNPDEIEERPKIGCYASDILIEGADWTTGQGSGGARAATGGGGCLVRAKLRNSINRLPIIRIIPVEMHKLKLQVRNEDARDFVFVPHEGGTGGGRGWGWPGRG